MEVGMLDPAKPLSLVYSKMTIEKGVDLDLHYQRQYFWRRMPDVMYDISYHENDSTNQEKEKRIEEFSRITSVPEDLANQIMFFDAASEPSSKAILKEMANEIEPWTKLIGKKKAKKLAQGSNGTSTRIYSVPKDSEALIKKSWEKW